MIFFKKKQDLKTQCVEWVREKYGPEYVSEFVEKYDALNNGQPIGGLGETMAFVSLVDQIKSELRRGKK